MSIDKFNKNILKSVDTLKDVGQDIQKNMSGFIDTALDTAGKTIDSLTTSFAFGKDKRLKNSDLSKYKDAVLQLAEGQLHYQLNTNGKSSGEELDWRVSLSIPQQVMDIIKQEKSLLDPLKATGNKWVFPYNPTVLIGHSANWNPMQPVHTNYPFYAYENSRVDQMTITAHFYVQNEIEARYWVAAVHYLRTMTKMSYGLSPNKGAPPPVVRLNGYGDFTFKDVPVIIQNFNFDLKEDVDYISTRLNPGPAGRQDANTMTGGASGVASKGGSYAWAPTESLLTIGVVPQYSRTKQAQFNLADFVKNGGTKGSGFI